jgi:hypothetical protein
VAALAARVVGERGVDWIWTGVAAAAAGREGAGCTGSARVVSDL